MRIFIVTNAPGELSGWVRPFARALKREKEIEVFLIVPPCQFASGREVEVAEGFPEIDRIIGPKEYIRRIFTGRLSLFQEKRKEKKGLCVFLGGDPFHAVVISKRLGVRAVAYMQKPRWERHFHKFFVLSEKIREENFIRKKVPAEKVIVVGDLVVDCVNFQLEEEKKLNPGFSARKPVISIMPGSRPRIAQNMFLFFLRSCELIREKFPQATFFLILSPFLKKEEFLYFWEEKIYRFFSPIPEVRFVEKEKGNLMIGTASGLEVKVISSCRYTAMGMSDLALTIPGTNTAELACLGIPMLVVLPLQVPQLIPLDGIAGMSGSIPYFGKLIKRAVVKKCARKIKFISLPNIQAEREIVPEMRGEISPEKVAEKAVEVLEDEKRCKIMSDTLKATMGGGGAALKMARAVIKVAEEFFPEETSD